MTATGRATGTRPTVTSRVLDILEAFSAERSALTITQIGHRAGLPLSTAHRLVGEPAAWGALERDADGLYRIGLRLFEVAALAPRGPPRAPPRCRSWRTCTRRRTRTSTSPSWTAWTSSTSSGSPPATPCTSCPGSAAAGPPTRRGRPGDARARRHGPAGTRHRRAAAPLHRQDDRHRARAAARPRRGPAHRRGDQRRPGRDVRAVGRRARLPGTTRSSPPSRSSSRPTAGRRGR